MDIKYGDLTKLFAIEQPKEASYRDTLRKTFNSFLNLCDDAGISDDTKAELKYICNSINEIVKHLEKGLHSTAFSKMKNLFAGTKNHKVLSDNMPYSILEEGSSLYRIRVKGDDEKYVEFKYSDMFHIPLNKKGIIRTQRYSSPGYPCLYVGESIYACWEEMHRSNFDLCMVSRLETTMSLKLLDLRIPDKVNFENADETLLLRLPIIIACMVVVKNPNDIYKPEYSITQLLTEWIISNNNSENKKEKIYGIRYTSSLSASSTSGFEYPKDKLDNIAFFVLDPLSTKTYCPQLSKVFKITDPTCNEYEKLKCGYGIDLGTIDKLPKEEQLKFNYKISDFGNLEKRLQDTENFPLYEVNG